MGRLEKGAAKPKPRPPRRGSKDAGEGGTGRHPEPESSLDIRRRPAPANVAEQKQPSPSVFQRHSGPPLTLFRRSKAQSTEEGGERLRQRRGSEPERQVVDRAPAFTRARLPSDPGLNPSEPDPQGATFNARSCLSPCASDVVRDYFSAHPRSSPQSGQQVALAVTESHREWLRRCSDPKAEPDLEQLLFAEESYV